MPDFFPLAAVLLILAAPCIGSFLGVVIERLPAGRPMLAGRSACQDCGAVLAPRDLVPLASWLIARGRCRHCGVGLGTFYPAIELGALAVALWSLAVLPGWLAWAGCGLGWALLAMSVIDARHMILPDQLTLPLIPAGLAVAWALEPGRLAEHALSTAGGFLLVLAVGATYRRMRGREGIGLGDAKLLAAAGAWVSWEGLPSVLLIAAASGLAGALLRGLAEGKLATSRQVPFGPYLAAGFWLIWLYGPITFG